ncbi:uncharacterized protein LOC106176227 [Lingula anatina]|uniref:Uncharacterized protein LOC106176227 n=1 Tax=Lingula anatina TaxID=7574 RepID=A0A1S3JUH3_LINAN|nr:uncharacterized protein LOC106176227 [Lingula anatina]|eukprot:XP_013413972.1 uncharacterized protein LOC106176227 [Lingula anatina]
MDYTRPDDDFVLHGRRTPMQERQRYLTNSQLTTTTRRLSQNSLYRSDNYRDKDSWEDSDDLDLDMSRLSGSGRGSSLRKSVSFSDLKKVRHFSEGEESDDSVDEELQRLIEKDDAEIKRSQKNGYHDESLAGRPKSREEAEWFTQPLHLTKDEHDYPTLKRAGLNTRSISPVHRPTGSMGALLAAKKLNAEQIATARIKEENDRWASPRARSTNSFTRSSPRSPRYSSSSPIPTRPRDIITDHFPVTFGAAASLYKSLQSSDPLDPVVGMADVPIGRTLSPPPKGLPRPSTPTDGLYKKKKKSKSPAKWRPPTATRSSIDNMYTRTAEAPTIGSSSVLLASPYQQEMARLRMERLRLEEEHLLELKREEELERIRGPKPKWYELKTPQFHYEAHKNNELIKTKNDWQDLLDYRNELLSASKDFQRSYSHTDYS